MSYILDALKKSESEREARQASIVLPDTGAVGQRRFVSAAWLWAVVLLVAIMGGYYGYQSMRSNASHASGVLASQLPAGNSSAATSSVQHPAPVPAQSRPAAVLASIPSSPRPAVAHPPPMQASSQVPDGVVSAGKSPAPAKQPQATAEASDQERTSTDELVRLDDLPVSTLSALPAIMIEAHIYDADPAARMAIINGSIRHEGQQLGNGLQLKEITEKGVVMSFRGRLFSMRTMESWHPN